MRLSKETCNALSFKYTPKVVDYSKYGSIKNDNIALATIYYIDNIFSGFAIPSRYYYKLKVGGFIQEEIKSTGLIRIIIKEDRKREFIKRIFN